MRVWILSALFAGALAGVVGYGIGRRSVSLSADSGSTARPHVQGVLRGDTATPVESPSATVESTHSREATSGSSIPKQAAASPRDRLFALITPVLSDQQRFYALRSSIIGNPELQRRVFDVLMSTEDREVFEAGQDYLTWIRDPELLKRLVAAFIEESDPDRKASLAHAVGGNGGSAETQAAIESILRGGDTRQLSRLLGVMNVQNILGEERSPFVPHLRNLVLHGASSEIRSLAAASLHGVTSPEGTRFLIDRMLNDPDPAVQLSAIRALPVGWIDPKPIPAEQVSALWQVYNDAGRPLAMRREAADDLLSFQTEVTEENRAALRSFLGKKN